MTPITDSIFRAHAAALEKLCSPDEIETIREGIGLLETKTMLLEREAFFPTGAVQVKEDGSIACDPLTVVSGWIADSADGRIALILETPRKATAYVLDKEAAHDLAKNLSLRLAD